MITSAEIKINTRQFLSFNINEKSKDLGVIKKIKNKGNKVIIFYETGRKVTYCGYPFFLSEK